MNSLIEEVKFTRVLGFNNNPGGFAASTQVDMTAFQGVTFLTCIAISGADNRIKVQQRDEGGSWEDIPNSEVTITTAEQVWLEVYRPQKDKVRVYMNLPNATTTGDVWAFRWGAKDKPRTNIVADTLTGVRLVTP